jgi:hypothetical protein
VEISKSLKIKVTFCCRLAQNPMNAWENKELMDFFIDGERLKIPETAKVKSEDFKKIVVEAC